MPQLDNKFRAIRNIPVATTTPLPPAVPLSAAGPGAMVERRVGDKKITMPEVLNGDENAQERALVFYATKAILVTECYGCRFDVRIRALGAIMTQDFVAGRSITDFNQAYEQQLEDPDRFDILSYHNLCGDVITGTCMPNTMVLKPPGEPLAATAPADRRSNHVKFVTFTVTFDFSELFLTTVGDYPKTLSFTTTAELPT